MVVHVGGRDGRPHYYLDYVSYLVLRNRDSFLKKVEQKKQHKRALHVACHPYHRHAPPSSKHQAIPSTHDFFLIRNYHCSLKLNKKHNLSNHMAIIWPAIPPTNMHHHLASIKLSHLHIISFL